GQTCHPAVQGCVTNHLVLDDPAAAARRLDALARRGAERVGMDGERLAELPAAEHLDGDLLARPQSAGSHELERHLGTGRETALERTEIHRLRAGPEGLERHRLLHVRPAQLSHAHVQRHLPALEAHPALGPRARARALLAAPCGLARARALAAPDTLARTAASARRRQAVQADALLAALCLAVPLVPASSTLCVSVAEGAPSLSSPPSPRTRLIDRPRSSPTSCGVRSPRSPATVALTRLIGFWVPRLLERMSWIPASSSTAR